MTDEEHFEAFVRAHAGPLNRTALLLTGSAYAAEDLLQETFVNLFGNWNRVRSADEPIAYVRRAMTNRFLSTRRSRSARDLSVWDVPDRPAGEDPGDRIAARSAVFQLLGTIPDRQRTAIVLRNFNDLTDEQIAAALDCRVATVRSLISRGMAAMRAVSQRDLAATGTEDH
ncbi:RNA polymerase sigma-70 factor, sigma-E family [Frankineae bacterium MT45]|nr:RNA polymerase sigma-70 factor, sigma-E family [Frankineae bacterium MT45]